LLSYASASHECIGKLDVYSIEISKFHAYHGVNVNHRHSKEDMEQRVGKPACETYEAGSFRDGLYSIQYTMYNVHVK
jgi:hypothetical protein